MDESYAAQYHSRFVSNQPGDRHFDNSTYPQAATQYLGKLPNDQFHQAGQNAVTQMPQQERAGLLGTLMGALGGSSGAGDGGGSLGGIARMLGLGSTDTNQMSPDDAAKLMNYASKEQPGAGQQTVVETPPLLKAIT